MMTPRPTPRRRLALPLLLALAACGSSGDSGPSGPQAPGPDGPPQCGYEAHADLDATSAEAVRLAPLWLKADLEARLLALDATRAGHVARAVTEAPDPAHLDELAFTIAHTAARHLGDENFKLELLFENVATIYARSEPGGAEALPYVARVEDGRHGADCDVRTTLRYRVRDGAGGAERWVDLPPDLYYWFVVHPVLEDERPLYIDPVQPPTDYETSAGEGFAEPPAGKFWRSYLYTAADDDCQFHDSTREDNGQCPVLAELLASAEVAWNLEPNDISATHAVGAVTGWVNTVMKFGAVYGRPIQPVRIYFEKNGNCGEQADLTSAAARAALLPAANASAYLWDHTFNMFWLDGWRHWEAYQGEANDPPRRCVDHVDLWWDMKGVRLTRGDGSYVDVTEYYTDQRCTLEVTVQDAAGAPLADAEVQLFSYMGGECCYWFFTGTTDAAGRFTTQVGVEGSDNDVFGRVLTDQGTFPPTDNQVAPVFTDGQDGRTYTWEVAIGDG